MEDKANALKFQQVVIKNGKTIKIKTTNNKMINKGIRGKLYCICATKGAFINKGFGVQKFKSLIVSAATILIFSGSLSSAKKFHSPRPYSRIFQTDRNLLYEDWQRINGVNKICIF